MGSSCCACLSASHALKYATPNRIPPDSQLFPYYFQNKQGLWLYYKEWAPSSLIKYTQQEKEEKEKETKTITKVKALLFIISGLGEHTSRYDGVALYFANYNYHCFCMDNQGAGGSEGKRLYVENFYDFVDDFQLFTKIILSKYPQYNDLPICVLGHSMGGLIATHVALREPFKYNAIILSGPALQIPAGSVNCFTKSLAHFLSCYFPKFPVQTLNINDISTNTQVLQLAAQDPIYICPPLTARWANEMLRAMEDVWKIQNIEKSSFPFLIVHGNKDKLCSIEGSRRFVREAISNDKHIIEYDGLFHEVLTEVRWREVLKDIREFLDAHCKHS